MIKPFIKWSGSKRSQASEIIKLFPQKIKTYYEPFLGSGAILGTLKPEHSVNGDLNKPLIELWELIQSKPDVVVEGYKKHWGLLQSKGYTYFYKIRKHFNKTQDPISFLFLSRTCVNGLIRFNRDGKFNNSLHHTRKGMAPNTLEKIIREWSKIIKNYKFYSGDYRAILKMVKAGDFVYLDPPYFNTKGRYFGTIDYEEFVEFLKQLNKKGIKYALSYDGHRGEKSYLVKLPKQLYKKHILLHSGNSTFRKVQDKKVEKVYESLYLNY